MGALILSLMLAQSVKCATVCKREVDGGIVCWYDLRKKEQCELPYSTCEQLGPRIRCKPTMTENLWNAEDSAYPPVPAIR